ncbi:Chromosome partition protein Smc [Marinomonas aquimarina]|uniref:Chromosome partition protein Smc n=1 Tax=Marinomonas aquimarina TaxID=295068 RepID=A0A1A8TGD0_9GAMM|nr:hypothetical protein [Marinomonas aquimarina]SBS31304.1 Chromosome partition protein Smc [Marinomonas aquimarina]
MSKPYRYVIPVALGTLLSACSHQSMRDDASSQLTAQTPAKSQFIAASVVDTATDSLTADQLHLQIAQNFERISKLAVQLDEKEKTLSEMMTGNIDASTLMRIQRLSNERDELELIYNQLHQDNERLTAQIREQKTDAPAIAKVMPTTDEGEPSADFVKLNQDFRTLNSAHYALSKNYRDLSIDHAHLKSRIDTLSDQNQKLSRDYSALSEENLILNGTLTDVRTQHQALWDKIRVQTTVIDTLQSENAVLQQRGGLLSVADNAGNALPDTATLAAQVTRLQAELSAQNSLLSGYQKDVAQLEAALTRQEQDLTGQLNTLETRYQELTQRHRQVNSELTQLRNALQARDQRIATLQDEFEVSSNEKAELLEQLQQLRDQYANSQTQIANLQQRALIEAEQKLTLENQVNNLIPFEGAVMSLQRQLQSELSNVRWTLPTSANLNDTFEIQLSAEVTNPVQGQTYFAELFVDSALSMMSAAEAESTLNQGQLNFRWRLSGLNERPNATMNVSVTQEVNYDGQVILRKIYRDTESVELISKDWLNKYGFWGAAILGGLILGFAVGKLGRREPDGRT